MGEGVKVTCRKCGFETYITAGMGFAYTSVIEELKEQALNGKYGEKLKAIIEGNPNGMINGEWQVYVCRECGNWQVEPKLSFYVPCEEDGDIDYFEKLGITKRLYTHRHRCDKCNRVMHAVELIDHPELKCPECGETLTIASDFIWD